MTPVPSPSPEEERALLAALTDRPPARVLVVSDLHLGPGRDPETGVFDRRENFLAADAFSRWLAHERATATSPALLILNGDIFDFIRIVTVPRTDGDYQRWRDRLARLGDPRADSLPRPLGRGEETYGLRTHDFRTVWKLLVIAVGHPDFFEGLARWVAAGNSLVFVKGNHDPELHWPLVRRALRDELVRCGAPAAAVSERVAFADDHLMLANVYIEHGHRYEAMTRIEGAPVLDDDPLQIRLPPGSFFNRYFINGIERLDPFIDNVKPVQHALMALLRRRPLAILGLYFRGWKFLFRALATRRGVSLAWALPVAATLVVPPVALASLASWVFIPGFQAVVLGTFPFLRPGWLRTGGTALGVLLPFLLPYLVGLGREVLRQLKGLAGPAGMLRRRDPLEVGAEEALETAFADPASLERLYAVMGHTHRHTVVSLEPRGGAERFYLNSGTWIPLWPEGRRDLIGRVIHSLLAFERGSGGEYRHAALVWDDSAGAPRAARVLEWGQ